MMMRLVAGMGAPVMFRWIPASDGAMPEEWLDPDPAYPNMMSMAMITNPRVLRKEEYAFGPWPPDAPGWRVVRVARERWRQDFAPAGGFTHEATLLLVREGRGEHRCGGRAWPLAPGDVVVRWGDAEHATASAPGAALVMDVVVFAGAEAGAVLLAGLGAVPPVLRLRRPEPAQAAFAGLFAAARAGGPFAPELCRHLLQALLVTIRAGLVGEGPDDRAYGAFSRARRCIDERCLELASLGPACRAAGVGPAHLSRLFRRYLGESPRAYLTRRRMQAAVDLLAEEGATVAGVAEALGFATPFAFSRAFRRVVGRTPSSMRGG
jgi:AraC-like DNA-binding protein